MTPIEGFSKLSKEEKIRWIAQQIGTNVQNLEQEFKSYWHTDAEVQKLYDEFSENTITNFYIPFGIVPNMLINSQFYAVPMAIEESSVVAAASKSAKFWLDKGGFKAEVISTQKIGQVHFLWQGDFHKLYCVFDELREELLRNAASITKNMTARGGGVLDIELIDARQHIPDYYQLKVTFETCDSMGANFINSCLENFAQTFKSWLLSNPIFTNYEKDINVVLCILSNYTPQCLVRAWVECPIEQLGQVEDQNALQFAQKFKTAIEIAKKDVYRATTHNKGIFNGIDAVVIATGNDFRAVEACGHTYAARSGQYRSLSDCSVENGMFKFWLDIPIAVGTVGGLTALHPMAKRSLELLGNPNAEQLMKIIAVTGLAQNFGAIKSLVTTGIQKGHMKMHLLNILRHFKATESEVHKAVEYFKTQVVSFNSVREFIERVRVDYDSLV
ncbi:MAG: hydroxymethylglutaryl-CoA reductase, degradative [Cytophagales bacterium]|nr:MAG: hydroxymethylglutaryl-CoA reductase, degradative [Cytophagales bacterium]TAF60986.1 MAG: hydroxymethylglutaryl-CoA reductase, degradative [Cytophagales bacterium]